MAEEKEQGVEDKGEYLGTEGTRPYAGAAWYYAEYRERVSEAFIARLAEHLGWRRQHRILDLGAGPAHLSLRVAPLVAEVVAVDPEPDMLAEGKRRAQLAAAENITFVQASSDDLPALSSTLGSFRGAVMGDSFHWMLERDRVLRDLSAMLDPRDGAVVIVSNKPLSVPDVLQEATSRIQAVFDRYLADVPPGPHPRGRHDRFEDILARSPFPHVERIERVYKVRVHPTAESLVGAQYTLSHTLARLGDRRRHLEQDVRAALADLGDIGEATVTRRDEALIGRR